MIAYSLNEYLEQFTGRNPKHVYTAICECQPCNGKRWVKIPSAELLGVANNLGYGDKMTKKQFSNLLHDLVQLRG